MLLWKEKKLIQKCDTWYLILLPCLCLSEWQLKQNVYSRRWKRNKVQTQKLWSQSWCYTLQNNGSKQKDKILYAYHFPRLETLAETNDYCRINVSRRVLQLIAVRPYHMATVIFTDESNLLPNDVFKPCKKRWQGSIIPYSVHICSHQRHFSNGICLGIFGR